MDTRLRTIVHELSNVLTVIRESAELAKAKLEPACKPPITWGKHMS